MAKTGEIMVGEGLVSPEDVDQALSVQERKKQGLGQDRDRLLGMVLCDLNLVTPMDNYCVLDKHQKLISVKAFLVEKNIVPRSRLDEIEQRAAQKGVPFISFLLEERVIPKPVLQQVLFDLFHIPLRSVSDIVFDANSRRILSSVIDKPLAGKHKVIPLQISGNTLMIGITGPENLLLLNDLDQKFPQYRFNPIFISFSGFTWFYKMLYREDPSQELIRRLKKEATGRKEAIIRTLAVGSSVDIRDPDRDKDALARLYDQYERLRQGRAGLNSHGEIRERADLFYSFIRDNHTQLCRRYGCRTIRFSLKLSGSRLLVMARPVTRVGNEEN